MKVYNFAVMEDHTYFVGKSGVLVHNDCTGESLEGWQKKIQERVKTHNDIGEYSDVGGHHIHAKAAFSTDATYDAKKGFSISQQFMDDYGLDHRAMTSKQRQLFDELFASGRPNTLAEHSRIAREALIAGGADENLARVLVDMSVENLGKQGVFGPSRIPWH